MVKITISRDNTNVKKLHNLASNELFDKRTVKKILEISGDSELVFSSGITRTCGGDPKGPISYDKRLLYYPHMRG